MALGDSLRGLFTNNPVNRVGPTGQPLIGGSNITDLITRSAGGLLGKDMRSPEEKILAAQQGIDTTTPQGAVEAAKARLQFETDPNARAQISNQIIQMQRQMASDAQRAKIEQERLADIAKGEQRVQSIAKALTDLDDPETANFVLDGTITPKQGAQHLGTLKRAAAVAANDLEGQRKLINTLGYEDKPRFQGLFTEDAEALPQPIFNSFVNKEDTKRIKKENIDKATVAIDTVDVPDERKELAKNMLENDLLTLNGVGNFLIRGQTLTNFSDDTFQTPDGKNAVTAVINGNLSSWNGKEWVEGGSNNPLRPQRSKDDKLIQRSSKTEKSLKNVLEAFKEESERGWIPNVSIGFYGDFEELKGLDKLTFQSTAMDLAETRSKENRTTVQDEMRGAVETLGRLIDNPIGSDATFSRPPNLNDFVDSDSVAPVAPVAPVADKGEIVVTQDMIDNDPDFSEFQVGDVVTED